MGDRSRGNVIAEFTERDISIDKSLFSLIYL